MALYRRPLLNKLYAAFLDLLPVILTVAFFQLVILRQPLPQFTEVLTGTFLIIFGRMLFVQGLKVGLFPIGETVALSMARRSSLLWLLSFAFLLCFSTTVADFIVLLLQTMLATCRDVLPVFALIFIFQLGLLRQPIPHLKTVLTPLPLFEKTGLD